MGAQTGKRAGKEREGTEMLVPRELYDLIIEIQHSNSARNQLLENTCFDVEMFGNLLSAAESVKFRIESDGGTSSWAALVEGLRRIYSTIHCTVLFGWTEVGKCSMRKVPVGDGMLAFDMSFLLEPRNEILIFDPSPVEVGSQPHSINPGTETLNPLSKDFWHNLKNGALPAVGPPQQGQLGNITANVILNHFVSDDNADGGNHDEIAVNSAPPQHPLNLSDCSDISDVSDKLFPQGPDVLMRTSKGPFCLLVNTPAGCPNRDDCGYKSHVNEGKVCKEGEHCRWGGKCAFVHGSRTTRCSIKMELGNLGGFKSPRSEAFPGASAEES
ncbi:hypothetical protein B5807_09985 [Epicoccum nigrum]|uniref:C3H1-type domain-containing protein n=1 Tax=Epicoccum nigrum TaxID=105696 RepID=A0A1Y2LWC7_EPING|nr:hypothetical protein B5807_09985 [Epicoccum nigrum]